MASTSTMLSAAIMRQYSSVLPLLLVRHYLPIFDEICGMAMNVVFVVQVPLFKVVNRSLTAQLRYYLSVIN